MLKIGDFSKLSRISIRMLRHYDEIGLLTPQNTDVFTGYRYYAEDQLPIAGKIASLKDMGFALADITEVLKKYNDPRAMNAFLSERREKVRAEAEETKRRLLLLDTAIERLRKDDTAMNYSVTLKTIPERYVASVRMTIPSYEHEHILWETMQKETAPFKMQFDDNCFSVAIFHDEGYKESDVDVEIQVMVKGKYQDTEHVIFKTAPAVEIASATYKGGYEQLTPVNHSVANWVNDNGYEFNGPMFCIYHVSPAQTSDPNELVTEVCYPVKKRQ